VFVAGFVGSPAMSLIPLDVEGDGANASLRSPDGWTLALSPANARKTQGASTKRVVLGARHSTLRVHKSPVPGAVEGKVYTVEPTGDVTFAQVFISSSILNISLAPTIQIRPDEPVFIEFDQERMHLFDGETEMALQLPN
jgi:multiple sugar transport system ATP-binding protein